ncbi:MAG: hypothetical protein HC929_03010 [Leptolyngbyaceae cyanobacterium SM2_5_2]|nr:hypothetical protein [Leptolyngbyaceae cyanobacterium SM2_5_2]
MTDTTVSNPAPEPQDQAYSQDGSRSANADASVSNDAWESVTFPGQITLNEGTAKPESVANAFNPSTGNLAQAAIPFDPTVPSPPMKESQNNTHELIELIQDLNQCNDALLLRVSELEDSLERSQLALQAEVERNQGQGLPPGQRDASPIPQQIAQLLSELDIANDGLRRTTIHNETLQTELDASQQRVAQLERECTLLQQRFSEKNTALQQAEATCQDLRARLHRQQRYTLQFKTALEKCLNTTAAQANAVPPVVVTAEAVASPGPTIAMPKAQHIQPWSAGDGLSSDAASLTHLLHNLKAPGQGPPPASPTATSHAPVAEGEPPAVDPAATLPPPAGSFPSLSSLGHVPLAEPVVPAQAELPLASADSPPSHQPAVSAPEGPPVAAEDSLQHDLWASGADFASTVEPTPGFTEPSPWGPPLSEAVPQLVTAPSPWGAPLPEPVTILESDSSVPVPAAVTTSEPVVPSPQPAPVVSPPPRPRPEVALPAYLQQTATTSPSPVVYPLRSQKKLTSLAAVQLPSFGRNPQRP